METFGVYTSEEKAKAVCAYLNNTFQLARDYPLEIKYLDKGYELIIDDYAAEYTVTLDKMHTAATDFWAGWCAHKQSEK